jgi:hypothetical protein
MMDDGLCVDGRGVRDQGSRGEATGDVERSLVDGGDRDLGKSLLNDQASMRLLRTIVRPWDRRSRPDPRLAASLWWTGAEDRFPYLDGLRMLSQPDAARCAAGGA